MLGCKTGGRDWAKGQSGNKGGRPKQNGPDLQLLENIPRMDISASIGRLIEMPFDDLMSLHKGKVTTTLDMLVASVIIECKKRACPYRLTFLLDRWLGPTSPTPIEVATATKKAAPNEQEAFYIVEINVGGKFVRVKPRAELLVERAKSDGTAP